MDAKGEVDVPRGGTLACWACAVLLCAVACGDDSSGGSSTACTENDPFGNSCPGGDPTGGAAGDAPGSIPGGHQGAGSGSGSGSGGNGGGDSRVPPPTTCASAQANTNRVVPKIYLLVDGSCSMELDLTSDEPYGSCDIDSPGAETRWGALRQALVDPQSGVVSRLDDVIDFGFYLFGTQPNCPLVAEPLAAARGQGDAIRSAFPASPPGSNTPTGAALREVVDAMALEREMDPDADPAPEILLLATDGAPNSCNDSTIDFEPSLEAARDAQALGVTMYVLSLAEPTGEFGAHLQEMADIGLGRSGASVYSPTDPDELASVLEMLIGGAVGCDVFVDGTVDAARACEGVVRLNGDPLVCGEDWELAGNNMIHLNDSACDRFRTDSAAMITASWPCGVLMVD